MNYNIMSVVVPKKKSKIRIGPISGRKLKTAEQQLAENPITGRLKRELDILEKEYKEQQKKNKKKLKSPKKRKGLAEWIE